MTAFLGFKAPTQRLKLSHGPYRLEVWPELGGAIARFDWVGQDGQLVQLFRAAMEQSTYMPTDLACWPLVPLSNRIPDGLLTYGGESHQLALNVKDHPHALHGVGWQNPWQLVEQREDFCRLSFSHEPDAYWPYAFSAEESFALTAEGLVITTSITNRSDRPMPFGLGQHPYIAKVKGTRLVADVKGVWHTNETVIPTHYEEPVPAKWNLPGGCLLDDVFMDNCFTELKGPVKVLWPNGSELKISGTFGAEAEQLPFLVVYNPPKEDYVCVEPVSHMTDAINRAEAGQKGTGHRVLPPGASAFITHKVAFKLAAG